MKLKELVVLFNSYHESLYLVGGAVRDLLLARPCNDIDLTTSCCPSKMISIANNNKLKIDDSNSQYGTIIFKLADNNYEVTTYRQDIGIKDNRRPQKVVFSKDLKTDLSRRDFTINAICYDLVNNKVIDLIQGKKDLEDGLIRAIGNPKTRISEDYLRIIRAYRFKYQLNFNFDQELLIILRSMMKKLAYISQERIRNEFLKIFLTDSLTPFSTIKELFDFFNFEINDVAIHRLKLLNLESNEYLYTLLLLFNNCEEVIKYNFIKKSKKELLVLNKMKSENILNYSLADFYQANKKFKISILFYYQYCLSGDNSYLKLLNRFTKASASFKLNFNAEDLKNYNINKKDYSKYLIRLENSVLTARVNNNSEELTNYLRSLLKLN